jgi:tellurite resistance protein TehA-like permease
MRFRLVDAEPVPDVFAAVMATGIVSVAAEDHHYLWISNALAGIGIVTLVVLTAMVVMETVVSQEFPYDVREPDVVVRLYTFVAACAVLGARFQAHAAETWALAALAWLAWLVLVPVTVRAIRPHRWSDLRDRAHGVWEVVSVATSGIAIVTAHLALLASDRVLFGVGVATWLLAIGLYVVITWLILWRVAAAPNEAIWRPDSWILMGGLAIATLAGDHLHRVALTVVADDWLLETVRLLTVVTWVVATLWIPLLVYTTLRYQRLRFTGAWWAMVFPLGMYSSATFAMSLETGWHPFAAVSAVVFWIALTAWFIVAVAAVCQFARIAGTPTP